MFKRLITRQLHRAFPELDRFDDDRARAFVAAAAHSWRRAFARWTLAMLVLVASTLSLIWVAQAIAGRFVPWPVTWIMDRLLVAAPILIVTFAISFTLAMRTRDWALQRSIRRLINLRGTCASCGYSLLGMPVPADLRLTCPECGKVTIADASMNELSVTLGGQRVYEPDFAVLTGEHLAESRRRRRRALKFAGIALAIIIGVPLLSYLGLRGFLSWQASRARANLARLNAEASATQASRPKNASRAREWTDLASQHRNLQIQASIAFEAVRPRNDPASVAPRILSISSDVGDTESVLLESAPLSPATQADLGVFLRYAQLCIDSGWDSALDGLLARPINFTSAFPHPDPPSRGMGSPQAELVPVERCLSMRTTLSLRQRDRPAFERDLRRQFALASVLDEAMYQQQFHALVPVLHRSDVLGRVESFIAYLAGDQNGEEFLAAIQRQLLAAERPSLPFNTAEAAARVRSGYEWPIAAHFSRSDRIEGLLLGTSHRDSVAGLVGARANPSRFWAGRHGTYAENKEAARVTSERIAAILARNYAASGPSTKPLPPPLNPTGRLLFEQLLIWGEVVTTSNDDNRYDVHLRALQVWAAIERHHKRTERLPALLTDLSVEDGIACPQDLNDPLTGKLINFQLSSVPRGIQGERWGYFLTFGAGGKPRGAWSRTGPMIAPFIVNP